MGLIQEVRTMSGNTFACERSKPIPVLIHQIFVEIKLNSITILFLAVCINVFFFRLQSETNSNTYYFHM